MGGGKGGGSKGGGTKKKKTYTKAQQMAKKRIADKKKAESTGTTGTTSKKTKLTGQQKLASLGRAPKSVLGPTKAQQIAKARIASGKTISQVKAANTASMKKAAEDRNAKFKQTRVQTFGGTRLDSSYSKAEQKRITDAGYSVQGYAQAKDNTYGTNIKSGEVPGQGGAMSEEARALAAKQLEAKRAEIAAEEAKKEATRKSAFNPNRLLSGLDSKSIFSNEAKLGGRLLTSLADTFDKPKFMYQGNFAGRMPGYSNYFSPDVGSVTPYTRKGMLKGIPFTNVDDAGSITKFKVPKDAKLGRSVLGVRQFKLNPSQMANLGMGVTDDVGKFAAKGLTKYGTRAIPFVGAGLSIADSINRFGQGDYTGSALAAASAIPGPIGWASLAGLTAKDISSSLNTGDTTTTTPSAGGLNIGATDSGEGGEGTGSKTGRTITQNVSDGAKFFSNLVQQPKAALAFGTDVASELFSPRLGDGTLTGNQDFAGRLPGDEGFDNRDVQLKSAFNNVMDSKFAQQVGENIGLPKDFKTQTKDALAALGENFKGATADRDGIYKGISETAKNLTLDPRLAPVAKFINESTKDDPNLSDTKRFNIMGIDTPIAQETAGDIVSAFQPDTEKFTGLSTQERGAIEGGGGNRIVSGKLTDAAREAITGLIGTGDSLNIPKGTPLSISNMLDAGGKVISNVAQGDTLASKRIAEIDRLADKTGDITTPSLIKGILPRLGQRTGGGGGSVTRVSARGGTPIASIAPLLIQPPQEEVPVELPVQSGVTDNKLQDIQQQAYLNQLGAYGMDPQYMAQFMPRRTRPRKFRSFFNRAYF